MGKWAETVIGDQATLQRGFDITKAQQQPGQVPVISSSGISSYHNEAKVSGPGVVLGRKGVVGSVHFVSDDYWPHDTTLWVKDFHSNYPRFVYYFFRWFAPRLASMDVGSANPTLNRNHVHPIKVLWPEAVDQQAIASILGSLDDKIENNRRMNKTLEEMARAIFKSWLVDFDPVHAKAENCKPAHMNAEIAALFPDNFNEDGLPEGWITSAIGDEVSVAGGSTPSTKEPSFWEGGANHWTTPKDLSPLISPVLLNTSRKITDAGLAKISSGLLPSGTMLMSSRAPVGYLAIAEVPTAINQGFIAMQCNGVLSNLYVLFWCHQNMDAIKSNAGGTTFQEISKRNFKPLPVIVPSEPLLSAFDNQVRPLYDKIVANLRENETLAQLRDTLLPKLMSGEIRVGDAQGQVEAVA